MLFIELIDLSFILTMREREKINSILSRWWRSEHTGLTCTKRKQKQQQTCLIASSSPWWNLLLLEPKRCLWKAQEKYDRDSYLAQEKDQHWRLLHLPKGETNEWKTVTDSCRLVENSFAIERTAREPTPRLCSGSPSNRDEVVRARTMNSCSHCWARDNCPTGLNSSVDDNHWSHHRRSSTSDWAPAKRADWTVNARWMNRTLPMVSRWSGSASKEVDDDWVLNPSTDRCPGQNPRMYPRMRPTLNCRATARSWSTTDNIEQCQRINRNRADYLFDETEVRSDDRTAWPKMIECLAQRHLLVFHQIS